MALQVNDLLQDRYLIVRSIKSGGMGAVYEAKDTKLADSPCAVKEILESAQNGLNSQYVESRFYQEMKALAALDHASIPKVRDYLTQDANIYIVMDLVQGHSLEEEVAGQPPLAESVVRDVISLLETIAYLHAQHPPIVHRDIKPANILRDARTGGIKLVDFGLARQLDASANQTLVGTLGYCAPEQMMGRAGKESDLYSVGVTLQHLLTGNAPEMMNFEPLRPALPGVRPGLTEIVEKATQMNPADRYASAQAMAADLQAWLDGRSPSQVLPARVTVVASPPSRRPMAAAFLLALGGAVILGVVLGRGKTPDARAATAPSPSPVAAATVATRPVVVATPQTETRVVYVTQTPQPKVVYVPQPSPPRREPAPAEIAPQPSLGDSPKYPTFHGQPGQRKPKPPLREEWLPTESEPPEVGFQPSAERRQRLQNFPRGRDSGRRWGRNRAR